MKRRTLTAILVILFLSPVVAKADGWWNSWDEVVNFSLGNAGALSGNAESMFFINPAGIAGIDAIYLNGQVNSWRRNWRNFSGSDQQFMNLNSQTGESVTFFFNKLPGGDKLKLGFGLGTRICQNHQKADFSQYNIKQSYWGVGVGLRPMEILQVGVSVVGVNIEQPANYAYNDSTVEKYSDSGILNSISVNLTVIPFVDIGAGLSHSLFAEADLIHKDPFGHYIIFDNPPSSYFISASIEPYPNLKLFGAFKGYYESSVSGSYYSIDLNSIRKRDFDFNPELSLGVQVSILPMLANVDGLKVHLRGGIHNKDLSLTHPEIPLDDPDEYRQFYHAGIGIEFAETARVDLAMGFDPYKDLIEDTVQNSSFREDPLNWKCSFSWMFAK